MKKRLLGLFLALCMVSAYFAALPISAQATASGVCGEGLTWTLDEAGTLTISGSGAMPDWQWAKAPWSSNINSITKVVIQNGVTNIGSYAFYNCSGLTDITIPSSVTSIGSYAFGSCTSLTSINIPNSVKTIGNSAFYFCRGLTSVTIPSSVTELEWRVFGSCQALLNVNVDPNNAKYSSADGILFNKDKTTLVYFPAGKEGNYTIPEIVTYIEGGAFSCSKLENMTVSKNIVDMGFGVFSACGRLQNVNVDPANANYSSVDGVLFDKAQAKLIYFPGGRGGHYTIPNGTRTVGLEAFSNSQIESITIPNSVTTLADNAFFNSFNLESVVIPDGVTTIGSYVFSYCTDLKSVTIPNSVESIGDDLFSGCGNFTDIYYTGCADEWGAIDIGEYNDVLFNATIHYNDGAESGGGEGEEGGEGGETEDNSAIIDSGSCGQNIIWTLSEKGTLKISGEGGMYNYWGDAPWYDYAELISSIIIKDGVTSIGNYAFYACTNLINVTIPNSVTTIGKYAFDYCISLPSIAIPSGITYIGDWAFSECYSLSSINVDEGNSNYSSLDGVLFDKDKTTLIIFPKQKNGSYTIPSSVTTIKSSAFDFGRGDEAIYPTGLTSVVIPSSVTIIEESAFYRCSALTSIKVDEQNNNYSSLDGVLFDKDKTTLIYFPGGKKGSYTIPNSVKTIDTRAFEACVGLTSIIIPEGVETIGEDAFYCCSGLTRVVIPKGIETIEYFVFGDCAGLTSITIPESVTSIGYGAFYGCESITDVYYEGDETQWREITIDEFNEYLTGATIHYNSLTGDEPIQDGITFSRADKKVSITSEKKYTNATIFIASYNADGLLSVKSQKKDINIGTTDIFFNDFDLSGAEDIKVMVWESTSNIKPLFDVYAE